jgi:hypothetical protein
VKNVLTLTLALGFLAGCTVESKTLGTQPTVVDQKVDVPHYDMPAPQKIEWITEDGGNSKLEFNPKIDILFVIDNSTSMKQTQENLRKNIDKFADGILKNKMIDYHIGVTSTWDRSEHSAQLKKDGYGVGDLRFTKDAKGRVQTARFLTRANSNVEALASTIAIGILPFEQGGPENEEFFAPILSAIEKSGPGGVNEGFFRDDAQLVVIVVTDADESQNDVTFDQVARTLVGFKHDDLKKIAVYGVLVAASDPDSVKDPVLKIQPKENPQCFDMTVKPPKKNHECDGGLSPKKLINFIKLANDVASKPDDVSSKFFMRITSPHFGSDLARIGSDITAKLLEKTIYLSRIPRYDDDTHQIMIRVRYGTPSELKAGRGQIIPPYIEKTTPVGWTYDSQDNSIHLPSNIKYQYAEGSQFAVDLVPVPIEQ